MHLAILKRVGVVLIVVGLIDIAVMVYSVASGVSYSSSFNIFAVVAGIFLLRGSLRAASIIRLFATFLLTIFVLVPLVVLLLQPFDLTVTQMRLEPVTFLTAAVTLVVVIALLLWVVRELGRESVQTAFSNAGLKKRDMRNPAATGIALVVIVVGILFVMLNGKYRQVAETLAEQQLGPGYQFHLSSISTVSTGTGKSVSAIVTAWNDHEIRKISLHWNE